MSRHRRPSTGIKVTFCFPSNVFRLRMTYWDTGSQSPCSSPLVTPTPLSIYYPGCDNSPLSLHRPEKAMKGTARTMRSYYTKAGLPLLSCQPHGPSLGQRAALPQPWPHELQPQTAEEGWGQGHKPSTRSTERRMPQVRYFFTPTFSPVHTGHWR